MYLPIVLEGQTCQLSHFGRLAFSLATWIYASLGHLLVGDGFKLFSFPREIGVLSGGVRCSQDSPRMWVNAAWVVHPINQPVVYFIWQTSTCGIKYALWTSIKNFWNSKLYWPIVRSEYLRVLCLLPWNMDVKCSSLTDTTHCQHQVIFLLRC